MNYGLILIKFKNNNIFVYLITVMIIKFIDIYTLNNYFIIYLIS